MIQRGAALTVLVLLAFALVPDTAPTVRATDLSVTLIGKGNAWRVWTETAAETNIVVNVGDTLRLRVENHDLVSHTFTAPRFGAEPGQGGQGSFLNATIFEGMVFFWNHTVAARGDSGSIIASLIPEGSIRIGSAW